VEYVILAALFGKEYKPILFAMNPTTDWLGASARNLKPMTNSPPGRTRLVVVHLKRTSAFAFVLTAALSTTGAVAADASHGEQLARQWCAACHIVAADQMHGTDNVPAFSSIAKMPGFSAENISQFLMDPHPKMPDMQLTRDEAKDLGAYIASLAH
jgi:mono/diheme cytochrome c family protein